MCNKKKSSKTCDDLIYSYCFCNINLKNDCVLFMNLNRIIYKKNTFKLVLYMKLVEHAHFYSFLPHGGEMKMCIQLIEYGAEKLCKCKKNIQQ